jgi:predicted transposase YdaD
MLLLPEEQLRDCSASIRAEAAGTSLGAELDDVIAAILLSRFSGRTVPEICAMGGITVDDFTSSVAYREIFGLGLDEGRLLGLLQGQQEGQRKGQREGRQAEAAALTLRQLQRRCGSLSSAQQSRLQALPLSDLEALAEALLDFQGPEDFHAWLSHHAS